MNTCLCLYRICHEKKRNDMLINCQVILVSTFPVNAVASKRELDITITSWVLHKIWSRRRKKSTRLQWNAQSTFDAAQLHVEMNRCPSLGNRTISLGTLRKCHSMRNQGKNWTWGSHLQFINPLCFTAGVGKDWGKKKMGRGKGDIEGYHFSVHHLPSHSSHYLPIFVLTCTGRDILSKCAIHTSASD